MLEYLRRYRNLQKSRSGLERMITEEYSYVKKNAHAVGHSESIITDLDIDQDELHDKANNPLEYGEELSFLGATHRIKKYVWPLFLIAVKTN